jgi:hypothetical protein
MLTQCQVRVVHIGVNAGLERMVLESQQPTSDRSLLEIFTVEDNTKISYKM